MVILPLDPSYPRAPAEARLGGHGTSEYFLADGYIEAILRDTKPPIDVYQAMDYTAPGLCAHLSAEAGGRPMEVPDFRPRPGEDENRA